MEDRKNKLYLEIKRRVEHPDTGTSSLFYSERYVSINLALADSELTDELQFHPCFLDIVGGHQ